MKKIFNSERIREQLENKIKNVTAFNEKVRVAVKFEDSLMEKGIIDSYNDRNRFLRIACDLVGVYSRIYSSAEFIERHGNNYEKSIYTQNTAITICKKIRARIGEQLKKEHPELVRTCSKCGETKHISEFYNNGYYERSGEAVKTCKACDAERERARKHVNKEVPLQKEKPQKETKKIVAVAQSRNTEEQDISKYAVNEIINNIRVRKNEVNNLFLGWNDVLKTINKNDKELITIELDALISVAKTLKKGIM